MKSWEWIDDGSRKSWLSVGSDPEHMLDIVSPLVCRNWRHQATVGHCARLWLTYFTHTRAVLLTGNDTVPISVWRGAGVRCMYRVLLLLLRLPRRICNRRCLFVCLSVKTSERLHEIVREGWQWAIEQNDKILVVIWITVWNLDTGIVFRIRHY